MAMPHPHKRQAAWWPAAGTAVLACSLAASVLWQLTDGLSSFTSEAWRRAQVLRHPPLLPNVALQSEQSQLLHLHALCSPAQGGAAAKVLVLDFVYTRCPTICRTTGTASAQLARRLADKGVQAQVWSVSLDPGNDKPEALAQFKQAMEVTPSDWHLARAPDAQDSAALLRSAAVVVIPDGQGGLVHNAALAVVDSSCHLTQLFDAQDIEHAELAVRQLL
jgi:protein SCO1